MVHSGMKASIPTEQAVEATTYTPKDFRADLEKIMPGYDWTVHRQHRLFPELLEATGIQSSGFSRLSTLSVVRRDRSGDLEYEAKSAGFGTRAPWLYTNKDGTLARALRGLQQHYETWAATYQGHANALKNARKAATSTCGTERSAVNQARSALTGSAQG